MSDSKIDIDTLITQVVSVTGSDIKTAKNLLETCDYNTEKAINLFFEGGLDFSNTTNNINLNENINNNNNFQNDQYREPDKEKITKLYSNDFSKIYYYFFFKKKIFKMIFLIQKENLMILQVLMIYQKIKKNY